MDIFIKTISLVLIALILHLVLAKQSKDFSYMLSIAACCVVASSVLHYLNPFISFFTRIRDFTSFDNDIISVIIQAVGIGIVAEVSGTLCADTGNAALGKMVHILATAIILCLSVPLFESLIALVEEILVMI